MLRDIRKSRKDIPFKPISSLNVVQCGWVKCAPEEYYGPYIRTTFSITFIQHGCGYFYADGQKMMVRAGEAHVIYPGMRTYSIADAKTPWEYTYVMLDGPDAQSVLEAVGLTKQHFVVPYPDTPEFRTWLNAMCVAGSTGTGQGYDVTGYFLLCISKLTQKHTQQGEKAPAAEHLGKAIAYMQANYSRNIKLSDVAAQVGLERTYLHRIFMQQIGMSPHQWLIHYRLDQSAELLKSNDYTITDIAYFTGFYDVSHFTRAFRTRYGLSPTEYRKENAQEEQKGSSAKKQRDVTA